MPHPEPVLTLNATALRLQIPAKRLSRLVACGLIEPDFDAGRAAKLFRLGRIGTIRKLLRL